MRCPQCGSESILQTTLGIVIGKDTNTVRCEKCGHEGTAQDWKDIEKLKKATIPALWPPLITTWKCDICKRVRLDKHISVHSRKVEELAMAKENIKYCNDNDDCKTKAKTYSHFGDRPAPPKRKSIVEYLSNIKDSLWEAFCQL